MTNVPTGNTKVTETTNDQVSAEAAAVPEDITTFYDKMDKEDEDEEEEHELKTVSFEVNQVRNFYLNLHEVKFHVLLNICKKLCCRKKLKLFKKDV